MIFRRAFFWCKVLLVGAGVMLGAAPLAAQTAINLSARYAIIMAHVHVGALTWVVYFSDGAYLASADGKASGIFSVLVKGEGAVTTHGRMAGGKLMPISVSAVATDDDGRDDTVMSFTDGALTDVDHRGPPLKGERIKVTPEQLHDVADPLSALLIPAGADAFAKANCDKTLRIFDGRRRYDLALSFKRVDKMQIAKDYSGPVLVCGVVLRAIAGYRTDSLLVRYLAGKDDLELWFAPIEGLALMAPVRAVMPTLIGTLELRAAEFKVQGGGAAPAAPPPAAPAPPPPASSAAPAAPPQSPVTAQPLAPPPKQP
jgi:Protein of unknown function (DUF3108)